MTGGVCRSPTINHPVRRVREVPGFCCVRFRVPPGLFRSDPYILVGNDKPHPFSAARQVGRRQWPSFPDELIKVGQCGSPRGMGLTQSRTPDSGWTTEEGTSQNQRFTSSRNVVFEAGAGALRVRKKVLLVWPARGRLRRGRRHRLSVVADMSGAFSGH